MSSLPDQRVSFLRSVGPNCVVNLEGRRRVEVILYQLFCLFGLVFMLISQRDELKTCETEMDSFSGSFFV